MTDFLQLPLIGKMVFIAFLWPAIWAGALSVVALVRDLRRPTGVKP